MSRTSWLPRAFGMRTIRSLHGQPRPSKVLLWSSTNPDNPGAPLRDLLESEFAWSACRCSMCSPIPPDLSALPPRHSQSPQPENPTPLLMGRLSFPDSLGGDAADGCWVEPHPA